MRRAQTADHSALDTVRAGNAVRSERRGARESTRVASRVDEAEHGGVEADAAQRIARCSEHAIADDGMAERGELSADLAAASGPQAQLDHG
jgi:hypothetical protein